MARRKTHEEFVKEVYDLFGNDYEVVDKYINARTKIIIKHKVCEHEWCVNPNDFLRSSGWCPECNGHLRKTTDQFKEEVHDLVGEEYLVVGDYINAKTNIEIYHDICSSIYSVLPKNFIKGARCPHCSIINKRKTHDEFVEEVEEILANTYEFLTKYVTIQTLIKTKHKKCGYVWYVRPNDLVTWIKKGVVVCPCCNNEVKYTNESYKEKVHELVKDEYVVLGEVVNSSTKVEMRHNKCGYIYEVRPKDFINNNHRCPSCNESKGEKKIANWLKENGVTFDKQYTFEDCKNDRLLKFDFVIFDRHNKLLSLVEYDGKQHFEPVDFAGKGEEWSSEHFAGVQKRDQIKNKYCKDNHINLYRIPHWKFDEIEEVLHRLIHNDYIKIDDNFLVI